MHSTKTEKHSLTARRANIVNFKVADKHRNYFVMTSPALRLPIEIHLPAHGGATNGADILNLLNLRGPESPGNSAKRWGPAFWQGFPGPDSENLGLPV